MDESRKQWELFVSGDKNAYAWLYNSYLQTLYNYGFKFTNDPDVIKDAIQEVFTHIYQKRTFLDNPGNVKVYLMVCMKNRLLDLLRKTQMFEEIENNEYFFDREKSVEEDFIIKEESFYWENKIKYLFFCFVRPAAGDSVLPFYTGNGYK